MLRDNSAIVLAVATVTTTAAYPVNSTYAMMVSAVYGEVFTCYTIFDGNLATRRFQQSIYVTRPLRELGLCAPFVSTSEAAAAVNDQRTSRNAKFLYFQVLIEVLLKKLLYDDVKAKQELIKVWKQKYCANNRILYEFERDYHSEKAVYCYTRPTSLCETMNKALRGNDIDILLAMRSFIIDLYRQQIDDGNFTSIFRIYRGSVLCVSELDLIRNSIGAFVSFNDLMSISMDIGVMMTDIFLM
ncbi:unnamed protein product [Didymodactylos carnosus]|uniref:Uncharacterized protein n=1 Tax=Didymodactylos carnosus TaxID=1234261 RepID=A0A816D1C0_9BILA|nr:unnamed protein product [Didymodactylos carnosus]CAF4525031.1 unnamed protein product [Didymodactylos carnosus]